MQGASNALKTFELENQIDVDTTYQFDEAEQEAIYQRKPWIENVEFFKKVRISAVALVKMVMHARSGGSLEIMGLMRGKVTLQGEFIVMDAFPLPVEGTETRVNAGAAANEFMVQFLEGCSAVGKKENVCGWYHSHPGYGCWLSGIDVQTQLIYQTHQEPFLAIVIDPIRTMAAGKVDIGAFRTYPSGYVPSYGSKSYQSIPIDKIEDFGIHCKQYYSLSIEYFKNAMDQKLLDALWNKYWIDTLSSSPLLTNKEYCNKSIIDTVSKLNQIDSLPVVSRWRDRHSKEEKMSALEKVSIDTGKNASEQLQGLVNQILKMSLFRSGGCGCKKSEDKSIMSQ